MKHSFTLSLLLLATAAFAQTEKGNSFVSGNISTGYSANIYPKDNPNKSGTFSLSSGISYGKFIKDDILWRIGVSETFSKYRLESNNAKFTNPYGSLSISSSGLYFFGKERWRGFVGGGLSISGSFFNIKQSVDGRQDLTSKERNFSIQPIFEAGALYFFNKHLAIQLATSSNTFPLNSYGFSTGLLYWIKPTSFEAETKELSILNKGRWTSGAGFDVDTRRLRNNLANQSSNPMQTGESETNISLQVGKFIKNKTMIGVRMGYSKNYSEVISTPQISTKRSMYRVGIFRKKYLFATRLTPYWEVELNYIRNNQEQKDASNFSTTHFNTFELRPNLGLAYLISNHFLVETQLADLLVSYGTQANSEYKNWSANLSGGLRPNLRLSYVF